MSNNIKLSKFANIRNIFNTKSTMCWSVVFLWLFIITTEINCVISIGHCNDHRFNLNTTTQTATPTTNTNYMEFAKEVIDREYGLLDSLKGLHCCAKGYRSIEWYKDGKPYPWSSKDSSLILFPEAVNQTIYTRRVQLTDAGNYTCVLRNDTHKKTQHISLQVEENNPDMPLATYEPHDQYIDFDNPARFYCEAFVGKVSLPDARSEITWWKILNNGQEEEAEGEQIQISRENGQIVGSYLKISTVQIHNYGRYVCRIQMGDASHKLEMFVELYGAPIAAVQDQTLLLGLFAAIIACSLTLTLWYLISVFIRKNRKLNNHCQALMKSDNCLNAPRRV